MSGFNFHFSLENFGLGLLTGWGTAYALYRARNLISDATGSVGSQAKRAQDFAARSADAGYINDLLRNIQKDHIAGNRAPLSDILVEPRFIKASELHAPQEEDIVRDVFFIVPRVHDHPYLHAPYNLHTLSVEELDNGDRALALLGLPGSGRSTALHAIALWSIGEVNFDEGNDPVQARLDAQERSPKSREESARRYSERVRVEDLAKEALADKQGIPQEAVRRENTTPFRQMTPMMTHLANVNVSIAEFGRNQDPAEPLVRALQHGVSYGTRMKLARGLYGRLEEGKVLLLLDGLDELPPQEQLLKLEWLRHLREAYSKNFFIVTGSVRGYGGLQKAGFTPVFLRPFQDMQTDMLANQWAKHWGRLSGGRRRNLEIDVETILRVKSKARAFNPLELSLRAWSMYENPIHSDIGTWMRHYLKQRLATDNIDALLPQIIQAAQLQLDEGFILPEPLDQALRGAGVLSALETSAQVGVETSDSLDAELDELADFAIEDDLDSLAMELEGGGLDDEEAVVVDDLLGVLDVDTQIPLDEKNKPRISKETTQFIRRMVQAGILKHYRGGRYQFAHPLFAAYFASYALQGLRFDKLLKKAELPAWHDALAYAASHTPMDDLARHRMNAPIDLLLNNLLDTVQWVRYASGTVEWLPSLMQVLAKQFTARRQYAPVRERIAAALVGSFDNNAIRIFEKSLVHPNADVRRLACLALGAMRDVEAFDAVTNRINDKDGLVQLAAVLALGAIGTEDALTEMTVTLTQSTEVMRQAAAESFAANPEHGYPVLYDAVHDQDDPMMRRAALFGLRRIRSPWALMALFETSTNDNQWIVKSAVEQVFLDMQFGDVVAGPKRYPRIDQIPWLVEWVNSLGEAGRLLTVNENLLLRRALEQADPERQVFAVGNMGQLGLYDHAGLLYTALRHREPTVREMAYRALMDIQMQVDEDLPAPLAVG